MKTLYIDIETYSEVNLLDSGLYRYASGKEFAILLLPTRDGADVQVVDIAQGEANTGGRRVRYSTTALSK